MEERKPLIPAKELAKRYSLFIISLFISAMGVAITKKGELGVSLIFFDLQIVGTREGTVISALCTGFVVKLWNKLLRRPVERILVGRAPDKT